MKKIFVFVCCLFLVACSGNNDSSKDQPNVQKQNVSTTPSQPAQSATQPAQFRQQQKSIFASIDPVEANQLIQKRKDLLVLDVRSPEELREGKIAGSKLVPFWEIAKGNYTVPAGQPVLLVCAVGGRSYAVGQYLSKSGYPEVYNLKSGISGWKQSGLPVEY